MSCLRPLTTAFPLNPYHGKTEATKEKEALDLPKTTEPGRGYEPRSSQLPTHL